MKRLLLTISAVCCLAPAAYAAHPLLTTEADPVAHKKFEAETAVEYSGNGSEKTFILLEKVTYGLLPKADVFVTVPFKSLSGGENNEGGLSDITIGAKWHVADYQKIKLSVQPYLNLPTGSGNRELGEGGVGFGISAIASTQLNKQLALDVNLLLGHQDYDHELEHGNYTKYRASVAGTYEISSHLKGVAEIALAHGREDESMIGAGVIYGATHNLELDCGVRFGLSKTAEDYNILGGVTFKF